MKVDGVASSKTANGSIRAAAQLQISMHLTDVVLRVLLKTLGITLNLDINTDIRLRI